MPLILKDRVRETTTATGTGVVTLAGAVLGYQAFSVIGDGNTTYYCIAGQLTSQWEVGIGTYNLTGNTLTRNTILASSNNDLVVNFSSGIKDIFVTYPANVFSAVDIQEFTTVGTSTWTKPVGARYVEVLIYGGGGGGGSGRRRSASTANAATGGAGGGAGARVEFRVPATNLANTETVVVGAGGIGGAAQTINETDGIFGGTGGNSQFGSSVIVIGGSGGSGGSTSLGGVSAGVRRLSVEAFRASAFIFTSNGGNGNPALGSAGSRGGFAGGGGGGGSGFAAGSTTSQLGRAGGLGGAVFSNDANNNTGGGGAAGAVGGDGGNGANAPAGYWVGGSGGGSGGCTSTQAGSGGVGGYPSGGGAGGAAASDAFNSGAGGDGGDGYVRVVTYL